MKKKIFTIFFTAMIMFLLSGINNIVNAAEVSEEARMKAETAYRQGVALSRAKAYEKAIESFKQALEFHPGMADAYYNIASIYSSMEMYDDAYNNYVKAIALNPYDYDSIVQAAKIAYNRKNYNLAVKYLKYVPSDAPQYPIARQMINDANELNNLNRNKIERAKTTTATPEKKVLIDKFKSPAGIAVDSEGNMFVACYSENAIVKIDKNKNRSNFVKDYLLDGPVGIALDKYDNMYIANFDADNILKVTKGGNASIFMNNVSKPYFIYIKNDVLYVSEQGNDAVIKYNLKN